ncbi:bifunctional [glutamate--ammonia ligase]-adenylyl-L-tyrosine phosphorylase/[glutamate--ammonia-ligase] adenylyltransferase [Thermithiobacillus plumbiphilus]|uniref:Bifunctional glutamine synthetase adenylyltransferase/adenylyl-removing enzyme n=1 Tax=Thermithiobacillus plumbiphilus TaxID=1729899 RepID=A0ABU9DCY6_9PROT
MTVSPQDMQRRIAAACASLAVDAAAVGQSMYQSLEQLDSQNREKVLQASEKHWRHWAHALCASRFLREQLRGHPDWLPALLEQQAPAVLPDLTQVTDFASLQSVLRAFRQRWMTHIIWREISLPDAFEQTVADLSRLAETCLQVALDWLMPQLQARHGQPRDADGHLVPFVVLGMGKLGGRELNLSSDIDLILAYGAPGETDGDRALDNGEFFARLGRQLIQALNERTEAGFVFRVDMRLRPFGESGPLAMSAEGLEQYYQLHGREWERYALIKARPVAGDIGFGEQLLSTLQPFIYRRYLDFTAFASLREIKTMIDAEIRRKEMQDNIKLGPGGIREIEFIVQAFQLIRGGQIPALRGRSTLAMLQVLVEKGLIPAREADELHAAYRFLRDVEHRLQMFDDRQTHVLPRDALDRERLACAMNHATWADLEPVLQHHRQLVAQHFDLTFAAPQMTPAQPDDPARRLWDIASGTPDADDRATACLQALGFVDVDAVWPGLRDFARSPGIQRRLTAEARARLDLLMPLVLGYAGRSAQPDILLPRFLRLIEAMAGRSAYLALLVENPLALSRLGRLLLQSPWIASEIGRYPSLLDEVLDAGEQQLLPDIASLRGNLGEQLAGELDAEGRMDRLRHFKRAELFRIARADLVGRLPVEQILQGLSQLAEVLVEAVLSLAWTDLVTRHGLPLQAAGGPARFCIVGFGKLGSAEMSYRSDLDLLFLHDSDADGMSDGTRSVPNEVFFARLGQRIIYYLSTLTPAGTLYSIDMRLRPSGRSGPLVTSLAHLDRYQHQEAWTWEHQALTRARAIAGDPDLMAAFDALRRDVLKRPREPARLRQDVRDMRKRLLAEFAPAADKFDLKHSPGGLLDLEFLVQYGRLLYGSVSRDLLEGRDTLSAFPVLAGLGLWSEADADALAGAWRFYRFLELRLQLQERPGAFDESEAVVIEALLPSGCGPLWRRLGSLGDEVRQVWHACLEPAH